MSAQDTPRAFPSATIDDAFGGMSKREWFAGMALAGMLADPNIAPNDAADWRGWCHDVARNSYDLADAMIEAGKRDG